MARHPSAQWLLLRVYDLVSGTLLESIPYNPNFEPVDILAFGPHPDDIEIGIGATMAKHAALGSRVGLCDLTAGEMGSSGSQEIRAKEAAKSAEIMGLAERRCAGLRLDDLGADADAGGQRRVVDRIGRHRIGNRVRLAANRRNRDARRNARRLAHR